MSIFNSQYTIKRVQYDPGTLARYDDPYLYKSINTGLLGENYYVMKLYKGKLLSDIQAKYPMVTDMTIVYRSSNTVFITLKFKPIDMVLRNQNLRFALVDTTFLQIYSGNKIANGVKVLDLPAYMSGITALSGLFYRQPASGLVQQVELLYQGFPGLHHIEYLPGGERLIVYFDGKKLYVSNLGDISSQVKNYELLKKYYKDYKLLSDIDLGSLEKNKVIVRKF